VSNAAGEAIDVNHPAAMETAGDNFCAVMGFDLECHHRAISKDRFLTWSGKRTIIIIDKARVVR
jgi:hypothetical protein